MRTKQLLLTTFFLLVTVCLWAEDTAPLHYDMNFVGRGEKATTVTVQSVTIENLSQGTSLELNGSDILRLTNIPTGIDDTEYIVTEKPGIYPNPSFGATTLTFASKISGNVNIKVTDLLGKTIISNSFNIAAGKHSALLPALKNGMYIVSVSGGGISESLKLNAISAFNSDAAIQITDNESAKLSTATIQKHKAPVSANVIEMYFKAGDLLRFTGKSGDMTTIVMNQPTLSHSITFDFYECKDASGRNYPIVNVGGLLWMAEDLGMVASKVGLTTSQSAWAGYPAGSAKAAYYQFDASNASLGAYYNHSGAKAALPVGWNLPTAGEVDYVLGKLGGYNRAANLLKSRNEADWIMPSLADKDSISFQAIAYGGLRPAGDFYGMGVGARYWTRSTQNNIPIYWGIGIEGMVFSATNTAGAEYGLRVRACRPAPSAYADIATRFKTGSSGAPMKTPQASTLFESGPLGGRYNVSSEKKKIFADYSSFREADNNGNLFTDGKKQFYRYDYKNGTYTKTKMPASGLSVSDRLKKATAVQNSNARENLAVAVWNRPMGIYIGNATDKINGTGTVSIVFYNDSTLGYSRGDSITLPDNFTMSDCSHNDWGGNHHQWHAWFYGQKYCFCLRRLYEPFPDSCCRF
ncbi:MAG: FISUMP domain-containing protein [Paludibacteraceae bacterium]